jgi:hypothetical protein
MKQGKKKLMRVAWMVFAFLVIASMLLLLIMPGVVAFY